MQSKGRGYKLSLLGAFRFESANGAKVQVTSRRSRALLALLALAPNGERSRRWLESMLWSTRSTRQAQASLRKELFNLRKLLSEHDPKLIGSDANEIWLDLERLSVDVLSGQTYAEAEFLEGLDLDGEEAFEDWLRDQRQSFGPGEKAGVIAVKTAQTGPPPVAANQDLNLAIAVLPFQVEPAHEELDIAAFGIGEELINRLSRLRWLPVIARSSSFSVPPPARNARSAGALLNALYVIEGMLKPDGSGFRLQVSLTHSQSGQLIWNEAFELAQLDDLASIEAALTGITAALDHRVDQSEQTRALTSDTDYTDVMQRVWKARWHFSKLTPDGMEKAEALLDEALKLAPMSAEILIEKTWFTIRQLWLRRGTHDEIRALRKLAQKASNADPDDARGYMLCGIAEFWLHQPERAEQLLRRAIELNPSLVMAHAQLGSCLHHRGARAEAIRALQTAKRLSPNDQDLFFTEGELAMAKLGLGEYSAAIDHAEASLARRAAYWSSHVAKINAHVKLEQLPEAKRAFSELMDAQPRFRPHFVDWLPYQDVSTNAQLRDGLNLAQSLTD